jgi:DNA-binding transcriptional ArsR family regulator
MPAADLTQLFAALADPTRRAILARLAEGEAPVKELVEPFGLSGPAITKHLKVLERAGLISRSRDGQQRPFRLEPRGLEPAAEWIDQYRAMWEAQLDRLGAYLKSFTQGPLPEEVEKREEPAKPESGRSARRPASGRRRRKGATR